MFDEEKLDIDDLMDDDELLEEGEFEGDFDDLGDFSDEDDEGFSFDELDEVEGDAIEPTMDSPLLNDSFEVSSPVFKKYEACSSFRSGLFAPAKHTKK